MATDKNGKLTYQMKSPGEAWNDHVNNDLNAKAVTPAYLESQKRKGPGVELINKRIKELKAQNDAVTIDRNRGKFLEQEYKKSDAPKAIESQKRKGPGVELINRRIQELKAQHKDVTVGSQKEKSIAQGYKKDAKVEEKGKGKDKEIGLSR